MQVLNSQLPTSYSPFGEVPHSSLPTLHSPLPTKMHTEIISNSLFNPLTMSLNAELQITTENKITTEDKIIGKINEFIIFMLTENDAYQVIYSKMNELDGEELEDWVNEYFNNYLANGCQYDCEGQNIEPYEFITWFNDNDNDEHSIFQNCFELMEIQRKLIEFYSELDTEVQYGNKTDWSYKILSDYCYMYINQINLDDLKEYIINLLEPVEPK